MRLNKLLLFISFFLGFHSFSQQRVSAELSSRLEDLSFGLQFQKAVRPHFLLGAGFLMNGRYWGGGVNDIKESDFPFAEIDREIIVDGVQYSVYGYSSTSGKALSGVIMTGYFHEFSVIHGLRFNLNLRCGMVKNEVFTLYKQVGNTGLLAKYRNIWHSYQALSPEIYHTIRCTEKFTVYYGARLPIYLNFGKDYHPKFKEDIYKRSLLEVSVGVSFSLEKKDKEGGGE